MPSKDVEISGRASEPLTATNWHTPSFGLGNKLFRIIWGLGWLLLARWTPPPLHRWRCLVLRMFGARIGSHVRIYGSTRIWNPRNLTVADDALIGPGVLLYNQGHIAIGSRAVVSQDSSICASTHRTSDPAFQLVLRPITIGAQVWIAAEAFVGPGVTVGEGAVLGARGVAVSALDPWTIYRGNPAAPLRPRVMRDAPADR